MINSSGKFYLATLESLKRNNELDPSVTTTNAKKIVRKLVQAYDVSIGAGHVGKSAKGIPANFRKTTAGPNGLIYGRIQSGKTRAMISSTAMAFDNGFRIAVVMTSNINDL